MRKLGWVHILLLIAGTASISFPVLSTKSKERDLLISQNQQTNVSPAQRLKDLFGRRRRTGGTQGEFCSISPSMNYRTTWSDRPLFVWQGTVTQIEVRDRDTESIIWSSNVKPQEQSILYAGAELKPGQSYFLLLTYQTTNQGQANLPTKRIPFQILGNDTEKRRRIEAELAKIVTQSQTLNAEEVALKRAEVFANEELWLDVIREVSSVSNPSPDWTKVIEEYRTNFCK